MKGLLFERNIPRIAASRVMSKLTHSGKGVAVGPLRLTDIDEPALPGPHWVRVKPILAGICGSDLSLLDGKGSRYYESIVSFPFVPGHEVVGTMEESGTDGNVVQKRVVVEPVLTCVTRGIDPPCPACAAGNTGQCSGITTGHLHPGLMTGYCADTGGGWSTAGLVAHETQIHAVPNTMDDTDAVMVEPVACAIHAALSVPTGPETLVGIIGSGTLGLTVVAALREFTTTSRIVAAAKYPHQRQLVMQLGADAAPGPDGFAREIRRTRHSTVVGKSLPAGADVIFDCVGSQATLEQALSVLRPGGRAVLVGMGYRTIVDLAPLWHRELSIQGSYTYGTETLHGKRVRTFDLAIDLASRLELGRLVSAAYPLERYEDAVEHAAGAGSRGAVKIVFDLQRKISHGTSLHA
ncbi:MAG: zinc-binding dehydrogenase [Actinobacteria bacterium]|nr:zinc-binding dehydrogenase [Actinomycetota bacterium]MCL5446318.1 zinc-binding dehydrogenase [Actinomycetota bacterium]